MDDEDLVLFLSWLLYIRKIPITQKLESSKNVWNIVDEFSCEWVHEHLYKMVRKIHSLPDLEKQHLWFLSIVTPDILLPKFGTKQKNCFQYHIHSLFHSVWSPFLSGLVLQPSSMCVHVDGIRLLNLLLVKMTN